MRMTRIILMSVSLCLVLKQSGGVCVRVCADTGCVTVNRDRVDFPTAEKACRDRSGELLTLHPHTLARVLDTLRGHLSGNLWIGLRLPAGACSDLSSPLRGYEWLSARTGRSFLPSSVSWTHSVSVCSPSCVSLSAEGTWTERPCSDAADGYVCSAEQDGACAAQPDPRVFRSSRGCSTGPCEHECTDVTGGYRCSCFHGYAPDSRDPRRCQVHCDTDKCPSICDKYNKEMCYCPDGYVLSQGNCYDINECEMDWCEHGCKNTNGSYQCSCARGFVLTEKHRCVRADGERAPVTVAFVKPNNGTMKASAAPAGRFLWLWICGVVAVVLLICGVRMFVVRRHKRREQSVPALAIDTDAC